MGLKTNLSKFMRTKTKSEVQVMILIGIIIVLVILRLLVVWVVILEPWRGVLVDSEQYLELARNLLRDGNYSSPSKPDLDLFRTPGYPLFLSLILGISGESLRAVVLVQFILILVNVYLLYALGKNFGNEKVGLVAGILLLMSPNTLFWSLTLMTETLFSLGLILAAFWMMKVMKGEIPVWAVGLLLGVITLVRPIGIFLVLIWTVWLFFFNFKRLGGKSSFQKAVVLLLASMFVLLPWYIRNAVEHGKFTLSNVNRVTLYSFHLALTLVDAEDISWDEAKSEIDEMGGSLSAAPHIIKNYPIAFTRVQLQGIARTLLGSESETWIWLVSEDHYASKGDSLLEPLLRFDLPFIQEKLNEMITGGNLPYVLFLIWSLGYTLVLMSLCVIGIISGLISGVSSIRAWLILTMLTTAYLVISSGAAGEARFRVPIEPLLAFMGGLAFHKTLSILVRKPGGNNPRTE